MRITLVNQYYVPDLAPTGHLAHSLAQYRAALGDEVTVVTSIGGYVSQAAATDTKPGDNPRVIRIWTPRLGKARSSHRITDYASFYLQAVIRVALLPRQDVIVSLTTPPFIGLAAALHKRLHPDTRFVLWNMDCYPEILERTGVIAPGGLRSRLLQRLNRAIFARLDQVVCLDGAMRDLLVSRYEEIARVPAAVIPNWEPLDQFPADLQPDRWAGWEALGVEASFKVLYLGNAGFGHSFDTILEAAALLRQEDIAFLFVGGGSKWPWLATETQRRGLDNVFLHPYVAKDLTPAVMSAADCAMITMNDSALGVISPSKLHANLAMSLPVLYVGPEGSNVDEAIQRYGVGTSLRHGDSAGVAAFLRELSSEADLHRAYRKKARSAFDAAFVDRQTLPAFDAILENIASSMR